MKNVEQKTQEMHETLEDGVKQNKIKTKAHKTLSFKKMYNITKNTKK